MPQCLNKNETIYSDLFEVNNCVFLICMSLVPEIVPVVAKSSQSNLRYIKKYITQYVVSYHRMDLKCCINIDVVIYL